MKLAFIHTNSMMFVTSEDNARQYAKELQSVGHEIEKIEIAPLGSGIELRLNLEVYEGHATELDLGFLE